MGGVLKTSLSLMFYFLLIPFFSFAVYCAVKYQQESGQSISSGELYLNIVIVSLMLSYALGRTIYTLVKLIKKVSK